MPTDPAGAQSPTKLAYEPPKLATYGTLQQLTQAKRGNFVDGGGRPATRLFIFN